MADPAEGPARKRTRTAFIPAATNADDAEPYDGSCLSGSDSSAERPTLKLEIRDAEPYVSLYVLMSSDEDDSPYYELIDDMRRRKWKCVSSR